MQVSFQTFHLCYYLHIDLGRWKQRLCFPWRITEIASTCVQCTHETTESIQSCKSKAQHRSVDTPSSCHTGDKEGYLQTPHSQNRLFIHLNSKLLKMHWASASGATRQSTYIKASEYAQCLAPSVNPQKSRGELMTVSLQNLQHPSCQCPENMFCPRTSPRTPDFWRETCPGGETGNCWVWRSWSLFSKSCTEWRPLLAASLVKVPRVYLMLP